MCFSLSASKQHLLSKRWGCLCCWCDVSDWHFHWGKFPLGCSDDIKSGLDVQIKLKPQNGGKGDGHIAPERFFELL